MLDMGLNEDLERVNLQESQLQFDSMNEQTAWEIGTRLRALAEQRGLSVVIDVRRFGQPLFYTALKGTTPDNVEWVRRKSNSVARFHRSSYGLGLHLKSKNDSLEARGLQMADYASHGGSFPIKVKNAGIVGSVTVSGLPQRDDHELVVEALCGILNHDYSKLKLGPEQG
jgi:uncharacterized protein (UPF0303 family)